MKPSFKDLFLAVQAKDVAAVEAMIGQGANLKQTDFVGNSILTLAAKESADIVRVLLAHNLDVNHRNREGFTPLMWAAAFRQPDVAALLIAHGADIDARNKDGWSVLMAATKGTSPEVVRLLLDKGVDIDARNDEGQRAVDLLEHDKRERAVVVKDMLETCHRLVAEALQRAEDAKREDIALKLQRLKQRAPRVRLKRPGL